MGEFFRVISQYDFLINVVSCLFTVLALVFTLYLWLLDNMSEDESKFIENKDKLLTTLRKCKEDIKNNKDPEVLLPVAENLNGQLEVILNYRFWARSKKKEDYKKITEFYQDSKYLISTIRRLIEYQNAGKQEKSLINITVLEPEELKDIQDDYGKALAYIIEFFENWN